MLSKNLTQSLLLLATTGSCSAILPRAANSTITSAPPTQTDLCCYLAGRGVNRLDWFTSSIEVVVATVSTIVYQYDDITTTTYSTILANVSLPTTSFDSTEYSYSGVPTDLVIPGPVYTAFTTLVYGSVFTDPYGVTYASPTPIMYFSTPVFYYTQQVEPTGCPEPMGNNAQEQETMGLYPSGVFMAVTPPFSNYSGEIGVLMPQYIFDWIPKHLPEGASPIWSDLSMCTPGLANGIPIAHIPVNALTSRPMTTITISSTLYPPTAEPVTETPAPQPTPDPTPEPEPEPTPEPEPEPEPTPEPEPEPTSTPEPGSTPKPTPAPESQPTPTPTPTPNPEPSPSPTPSFNPEPTQSPSPSPNPNPEPNPSPNPEPIPTPSPSPNPEPNPTPSPAPGESQSPNPVTPITNIPPSATPITIGTITVSPGETITLSGSGTDAPTTIFLPPTGSGVVIIDSSPVTITPPTTVVQTTNIVTTDSEGALTTEVKTLTSVQGGNVVVGPVADGVAVVRTTTVVTTNSEGVRTTEVKTLTSTKSGGGSVTAAAEPTPDIVDVIASMGGFANNTSAPEEFEGGAGRLSVGNWLILAICVLGILWL